MTGSLTVLAPDGAPEISAGDDLVRLLVDLVDPHDGDVVAVTSKVVAKAEGRVVAGGRAQAVAAETRRVVARRGETVIVRTRQGLTLAAAGIDASNVAPGLLVLLPRDPDASARTLRTGILARTGANVAVIVTDTAGRAWRHGQTDIAVGAAGLVVTESFAGRVDGHGNPLTVTAPAVADELAGAAELAQGKLTGRPFAVLRGRADLVLPGGDHGAGAAAPIRGDAEDLFGFGAREAVVRALTGAAEDLPAFGSPATEAELRRAVAAVLGPATLVPDAGPGVLVAGEPGPLRALAFAHGWQARAESAGFVRIQPFTP